jgi:Ca2+-binding EF-hand superfamily protein
MYGGDSFEDSSFGVAALMKAKELFALCDKEDKGFIIKRDMQRLSSELPVLTPEQLEEVFDSLDQDKNGYLSPEEFTRGFGNTTHNINIHSVCVRCIPWSTITR